MPGSGPRINNQREVTSGAACRPYGCLIVSCGSGSLVTIPTVKQEIATSLHSYCFLGLVLTLSNTDLHKKAFKERRYRIRYWNSGIM